jgi:hypothetical protein
LYKQITKEESEAKTRRIDGWMDGRERVVRHERGRDGGIKKIEKCARPPSPTLSTSLCRVLNVYVPKTAPTTSHSSTKERSWRTTIGSEV